MVSVMVPGPPAMDPESAEMMKKLVAKGALGAGVLATDALAASGGRLAALAPDTIARLNRVLPPTWSRGNPVDIIGDASGTRYADALTTLLRDPEVDAILVLNCPTALAQPEEAARAVIDAVAAAEPATLRGRNVITAWLGEQGRSFHSR